MDYKTKLLLNSNVIERKVLIVCVRVNNVYVRARENRQTSRQTDRQTDKEGEAGEERDKRESHNML